ncbi:hypothetical protein AB0L63_30635 [Nocardia sp. NPDC051990]|uniref:hypothetical protein n=1 Tax=Nocardia sp. NPDC051990 TaxID=3155285 RepID=UPI00341D12D8
MRDRLELGRNYARAIGAWQLSRCAGVTVDPGGAPQRIMLAALEKLARLHLTDPQQYPDELVLHYIRSLVAWATHVRDPKKAHRTAVSPPS